MTYELVVVGASWGGVAALRRVLHLLPPEFDLPIAIVQHRGPSFGPDTLVRLLRESARSPVSEPEDKEPILRGRVYVAPPEYHLLVEPGAFALSTDARVRYARPSIDVLFESAANAYGARVVGTLLTGANDDGARGAARIKAAGGAVVVQAPESAERGELPAAAIAATDPDGVLPLDEIAPFLAGLAQRRTEPRAGRTA
ncbi:MAG: chemotaxis protein CheB [Gaiellaceae bacterium]